MNKYFNGAIVLLFLLILMNGSLTTAVAQQEKKALVREEQTITVNGKTETWRLEWLTPPKPVCPPEDDGTFTCPCEGFQYGEQGELNLVRVRAGEPEEQLHLTNFFVNTPQGAETPGNSATLPCWQYYQKDYQKYQQPDFPAQVRKRPLVKIMNFADYNRDGQATEFVLQIGTASCGHTGNIVVGISADNPHLHAFATAENPLEPLELEGGDWLRFLKSNGQVRLVEVRCGDHGSDTRIEIVLRADEKGLHATEFEYQCTDDDKRGRLLSRKKL